MRKRLFSLFLCLSLIICFFPVIESNAADYDYTRFNQIVAQIKNDYPDGTVWTNDTSYPSGWYGCWAFANYMADHIFGNSKPRSYWSTVSINNVLPGDIISTDRWTDSGWVYGHTMFVIGVNGNNLTIAEGNYNGVVKWGRVVSKTSNSFTVYHATNYDSVISKASPVNDAPKTRIGQTYFTDSQDIYISWNSISGATSYEYYLTEYPAGYAYTTNTRHGSTSATGITFKGSELKNGHYSFFCHATNSAGQGPQSSWVSFDVYAQDYVPIKTSVYKDHIYALYDCEMSWSFARDLCTNMGGHLVTVNNQAEETFLEGLIQSGAKDAYWLGATNYEKDDDINHPYKWVTGESFSYTNWKSGEPSFSGDNGTRERFIEIRKSYESKWNDVYNINKSNKGFILEIEPNTKDITFSGNYNGHSYYVIDRNTTWTEAQIYCETLGGHLVTIDNTEESNYIDRIIKNGSRAWYYMGAKRVNGSWKWINGNVANNINKDERWDAWVSEQSHNYLMKYKQSLSCVAIGNTYYPAHDIKHIGFICEVDGHIHSYTPQITDPTCTTQGFTTYVCSECGESYIDSYVNPTGHSYTDTITKPTCTEQGYTTHTCAVCGDNLTDSYTDALGHNWDTGTIVQEPTESQSGIRRYTCSRCKETRDEIIPSSGHIHNYQMVITSPTCTDQGFTTYICNCGDVYLGDYVSAVGHAWDSGIITREPTQTSSGLKTYTCTRCNSTRIEVLSPLVHEHSYIGVVTSPTCSMGGFTIYQCVCGASYLDDETDALGHLFVDGICSRCGEVDPYGAGNGFLFDDVKDASKFYYNPIYWAFFADPQITNGIDKTHFGPEKGCTRGQVVTFLWRAAGCPEPENAVTAFTDLKDGGFYVKAVAWAVENDVTKGMSADKFAPDDSCTRGQIVTFLWRFMGMSAPKNTKTPFTDLKNGGFYVNAVAWAVENEITKGMSADKFAPDDSCTRGQIVTFLYRAISEQ